MPIRREGTIGMFRSQSPAPGLSAPTESEKDPGRDKSQPPIIRRKLHGGAVEPRAASGGSAFYTLQVLRRAADHGSGSMRDPSYVDSALAHADTGSNSMTTNCQSCLN